MPGCATRSSPALPAARNPRLSPPRLASPNRAVRLASLLALARQRNARVADFLDDADPALAAEAAIAIHDDLSIHEALPQLAAWLAKAPASSTEPALRRAVNANFRVGTSEAAARLATFALKSKADPALRGEALSQLTLWTEPPLLDHADGRYRKLSARAPEPVRAALQPEVNSLLALEEPELRALGLELLLKFHLKAPTAPVVALVADSNIPPAVRLEGLRLLAAQDPDSPALAQTLDAWLRLPKGVQPAPLRAEALRILAKRESRRAFDAARAFLGQGETEEQQAAWSVLAALADPAADTLIAESLNKLAAGRKVAAATQLDLLEAAATRAPAAPNVAAARDAYEKLRDSQTEPLAAFTECLEGGDPAAGREIAQMNVAANCVACHRFARGSGSEVGPPLETIASRHDRRYLLESLIDPGAQVAAGFGLVTVTRKNGETLAGTLLVEDAESVRLRLPDGKEISVPRDGITAETPAISMMPPMGAILTKRQLRDVVAYLATLRPPPKQKKPTAKAQE